MLQSDLVATPPLVPSKNVIVSWMSLCRCTAMYCQDRACPLKICHCNLDVTVYKIAGKVNCPPSCPDTSSMVMIPSLCAEPCKGSPWTRPCLGRIVLLVYFLGLLFAYHAQHPFPLCLISALQAPLAESAWPQEYQAIASK